MTSSVSAVAAAIATDILVNSDTIASILDEVVKRATDTADYLEERDKILYEHELHTTKEQA